MGTRIYVGNWITVSGDSDLEKMFAPHGTVQSRKWSWTATPDVQGFWVCRDGQRGRGPGASRR